MKSIKKLIALTLIGTSIVVASPIEANAAWKANDKGWWYTEGNSWATGWRNIGGAWYYFYSNGYMAHDTTIDGYYVNSYGEYEPNHSSKIVSNGKEIQSGTYKVGTDIPAGEYIVFPGNDYGYYECTSDTSGDIDSVIYNQVLLESDPSYVTVNSGEYFTLDDAVMYKVSEAPSIKPSNNLYKAGQYKVGKDIPAGRYRVTDLGGGYVEVNVNSRHSLDDAIICETLTGDMYITVENGQYIELSNAQIQA